MYSRLSVLIAFAALLLIPATSVWAIDFDVAASVDAIEADFETQQIDADQAALQIAFALFDNSRLQSRYHRAANAPKIRTSELVGTSQCGTAEILKLRRILQQASAAVRAQVQKIMMPGTPRGVTLNAGKALGHNPLGTELPNNYYTEHFAIRWGDSYAADTDTIEFWGQILEDEIWDTEVVAWDYPDVYASDTYYVDVYIGNSGSGAPIIDFAGAYTTIYDDGSQWGEDGEYQPLIVFHPDLLAYESTIQSVSAHEFFHTLQFTLAVNGENYYIFDQNSLWWIEGTATWASSVMYEDLNDYVYYVYGWSQEAFESLTKQGNGDEYGRVIWARFLYEFHGGLDAIHEIWVNGSGTSALFGNAGYLKHQDMEWDNAWVDFVQQLLAESFEDNDVIPNFGDYRTVATFPYAQWEIDGNQQPHINSVHKIMVRNGDETDPRLNIWFQPEDITLDGADWLLVAYKETAAGDIEAQVLDVSTKDAPYEFTIDGLGSTYDRIHLLITPISSTEDNYIASWDYMLQLTRGDDAFQEPPVGDDDTAGDDDTIGDDDDDDDDDTSGAQPGGDDDDDDDDGGGCGC
ncbi:MAG: hypothetical protein P9L99_09875 [Candidatus Lernaella stagnicola]|nr:hypothetical protein [Candidatus Lernaella stagnicola]